MTLIDLPALQERLVVAGQLLVAASVVAAFLCLLVLLWMARHE